MNTAAAIRSAQETDLAALAELSRACFGESALAAGAMAPSARRITLLAERGGACAGYIVLALAADEAEIESLAVEAAQRRQGVATALLEAGSRAAEQRGARTLHLEVRESNRAARTFYARRGFTESGRRPGYYRQPEESAVLLRRDAAGTAASG